MPRRNRTRDRDGDAEERVAHAVARGLPAGREPVERVGNLGGSLEAILRLLREEAEHELIERRGSRCISRIWVCRDGEVFCGKAVCASL